MLSVFFAKKWEEDVEDTPHLRPTGSDGDVIFVTALNTR